MKEWKLLTKLLVFILIMKTSTSLVFKNVRTKSEQINVEDLNVVKGYFRNENSLGIIMTEGVAEESLPVVHLPVTIYSKHSFLENCILNTLGEVDGYIFVTDDNSNLEEQTIGPLKCIRNRFSRIKTTHILIFHTAFGNQNLNISEAYTDYLNYLWMNFGIIHIAIVPIYRTAVPNVIFAYNPFLVKENLGTGILIKHTLSEDFGVMLDRRVLNLHKYTLNVTTNNVLTQVDKKLLTGPRTPYRSGLSVEVMFKWVLEDYFNVSLNIINTNDYWLECIRNDKAEFALTATIPQPVYAKLQVVATNIKNMRAIVLVPKPREIQSWLIPVYVFKWRVLVAFGFTLVTLYLLSFVFVRVSCKETTIKKSLVTSVWKTSFSSCADQLPVLDSHRLLLASSLLLGLILATLFSSQTFNLMKNRPKLAQINTLQDLENSNMRIVFGIGELKFILEVIDNPAVEFIKQRADSVDNFFLKSLNNKKIKPFEEALSNLTAMNAAVVFASTFDEIAKGSRKAMKFWDGFDVLKEELVQVVPVYYMASDSVHYERYNLLSIRVGSAGLFKKWVQDFYLDVFDSESELGEEEVESEVIDDVALSYSDLKLAYYALYMGLGFSVVCFILEILIFNCTGGSTHVKKFC